MIRAVCLALAAATLLHPASARADGACLLCAAPAAVAHGGGAGAAGVTRPPIEIEMTSGFNFRRFAQQGAMGEVIVDAARSSLPDVGAGGGYGLVGQVLIRGAPNAPVHVELPHSILLTSMHGGRIEIARIESTLPKSPRLDANGRLEFSFNGPLSLPAGARPGDYQASFSIDADYE